MRRGLAPRQSKEPLQPEPLAPVKPMNGDKTTTTELHTDLLALEFNHPPVVGTHPDTDTGALRNFEHVDVS